jgi:hypothetical protein
MIFRKAVVAVGLVCLAVPLASGQNWPKEQIPAPRICNEIKAHTAGLAVWWTAHNGYANEVKLRLSKPLQERFHILKQGQKLMITRP